MESPAKQLWVLGGIDNEIPMGRNDSSEKMEKWDTVCVSVWAWWRQPEEEYQIIITLPCHPYTWCNKPSFPTDSFMLSPHMMEHGNQIERFPPSVHTENSYSQCEHQVESSLSASSATYKAVFTSLPLYVRVNYWHCCSTAGRINTCHQYIQNHSLLFPSLTFVECSI